LLPGPFDRELPGALGDHLAAPPVAVDHHRGVGLAHDLERRTGHDVTLADAVDVGRDLDDAVAVVPGEVGRDRVACDGARFLLARSSALQQYGNGVSQSIGGNAGHGSSPKRLRKSQCSGVKLENGATPYSLPSLAKEGRDATRLRADWILSPFTFHSSLS